METTLTILIIDFVLLTASVLFLPNVKLGRIKAATYPLVALLGAVALIATKKAPIGDVLSGLVTNDHINPLKILILFFSMTFLSIYLDEAGFFKMLATRAANRAKANQKTLFIIIYFLTAVLTVFTSNDIVILTLTPFICFFCKNTDVDPIPYLVGEFAAANTWSMMFVIGNPTNIYLATSAGIGFAEYFSVMALPTLAAGLVEFGLIMLIFSKKLKKPLSKTEQHNEPVNKPELIVGVIHLIVCLVFLVISDYIGGEMWLISALCALSLLIASLILAFFVRGRAVRDLKHSFVRLPWQLIPFVLSMYVMTIAAGNQGISNMLASALGTKQLVFSYGAAAYLISNLINNIPMSMLFSTLTATLEKSVLSDAVYASIIGSNIGAFLTPIGALAGIMFTELTARFEVKYGFKQFIKYGVLISLPTIAAALVILWLL